MPLDTSCLKVIKYSEESIEWIIFASRTRRLEVMILIRSPAPKGDGFLSAPFFPMGIVMLRVQDIPFNICVESICWHSVVNTYLTLGTAFWILSDG